MEADEPARPGDTLHPVRRLRGTLSRRTGPPAGDRGPARAAPGPEAPLDVEPAGGRPSRLHLVVGIALVLAVSAAWSAIALQGRAPSVPGAASAVPTQAPADAVGNLRMYSASAGWAQRLDDGAVLHTTRGVLHWGVASPPTSDPVIGVSYVGAETARAVTVPASAEGDATIRAWATGDGGATWSAEGSFPVVGFSPALVGALDFVDPLHGWYSQLQDDPGVTGTELYRTADGGAHWSPIAFVGTAGPTGTGHTGPAPTGCVQLTAAFVSTTTGWLSGSCSTGPPPLYVSHDGGATWAAQTLAPISGRLYGEQSSPPSFTSPRDGTLLTEDIGAAPVSVGLYATVDGGKTWSLRYSGAGTLFTSDFVDAEHGWLALSSPDGDAAAPDLHSTRDGGSTWTVLHAFPPVGWNLYVGLSLDFLNDDVGWASTEINQSSGGASYLLETVDGGQSWAALRPQLSA
ncbi:MAG: WD40/YVTN/BNR-like repeat-containing protein [Candidatus Dormibacteria bacterium]